MLTGALDIIEQFSMLKVETNFLHLLWLNLSTILLMSLGTGVKKGDTLQCTGMAFFPKMKFNYL